MPPRVVLPDMAREHLARWYGEEFLEDVAVLRGTFLGWLFGRFGQHAVTINKRVHLTSRAASLDSDSGISLIGHEFYHVVQQTEMGWWRFLARYVWHWRPTHIRHGRRHPMEKPAFERGSEIRQALRG